MGKGDSNINYPAQPSYGEGMSDALKAQVQLLTGTGDFKSTGSLESLLPLEESIRKKTAQTDTDILRQTLLGGNRTSEVKQNKDGKFFIPNAKVIDGADSRYQQIEIDPGQKATAFEKGATSEEKLNGRSATYGILDTKTGGITKRTGGLPTQLNAQGKEYTYVADAKEGEEWKVTSTHNTTISDEVGTSYTDIKTKISDAGGDEDINLADYTFQTQAGGDGMVDLLGDKRGVQNTVAKEVTKTKGGYSWTGQGAEDAGREYYSTFDDEGNELRTGLSLAEAQKQSGDKRATSTTETVYEQVDAGREAGFDESGNFLGLSAYGEDIQAGNLSRQRERDLQDVARLSGTYQDIMEDYKPGTQEALESAREVLEGQKESLTGPGAIGGPQGITDPLSLTSKGFTAAQNATPVDLKVGTSFKGAQVADPTTLTAPTSYTANTDVTGSGYTADKAATTGLGYSAAQAGDPMALKAATSYDPSAGVTGSGYSAVAGLDGGQIQADSLRAALMADAEGALKQGLTDREERQIAEAARARSTMMGRTFDQSGAIAEAQARVAEDNARKMQNRVFAQQALGQEAELQESDLGRGLQAGMQNQAAQNQALQYSAGQDMQAQLANQGATNQALQAGMAAGLSQEALAAQQKQAQDFANMQAQNQALGFSAQQQQAAQFSNQQATNRASEFGSSQALNAALANQQATNRASEFGVQAGLGQEQLSANMAQQKAMADAGFTQQARATELEAGLTQEQAEAQLNQQRLMANQQFSQEANKYGAQEDMQVQLNNLANQISNYQFETGAQMDADRLNEQLTQSGILGYIQAAGGLAALEDQSTLDPFQAVLGRGGGGSLQAGQSVFGQAGYGLNSAPQYLNPESGLGYIQNQATNAANMYNAQVGADATKTAGIFSGLGSLGGGLLGGAGAAGGFGKLFS